MAAIATTVPPKKAAVASNATGGDERRRTEVPSVRTCIACQSERDAKPAASLFNRRGSKDSQLR